MSSLLDANALIALCWPAHEHHATALAWFSRHAREGWSTSPLTQSAFVRIVSKPAFAGRSLAVAEVAELLLRNTEHPHHRLLPLDFGFAEVLGVYTGGPLGHRQVTDAYLLTSAIRGSVRRVTFDHGIGELLATQGERDRHLRVLQ